MRTKLHVPLFLLFFFRYWIFFPFLFSVLKCATGCFYGFVLLLNGMAFIGICFFFGTLNIKIYFFYWSALGSTRDQKSIHYQGHSKQLIIAFQVQEKLNFYPYFSLVEKQNISGANSKHVYSRPTLIILGHWTYAKFTPITWYFRRFPSTWYPYTMWSCKSCRTRTKYFEGFTVNKNRCQKKKSVNI